MNESTIEQQQNIPFWRDERVLQILWQIIFLVLLVTAVYTLYSNMINALARQGLLIKFSFLKLTAGFAIGEHLIPFDRSDTFLRAFYTGMLNTILVSVLGIIFATLLGIVVGVARLSSNFLINKLSSIYIEIIRNIPLLVLLIFWYTGVFLKLPRMKNALHLGPNIMLSNRGIAIPWGIPSATFKAYLGALAFALVVAIAVGVLLTRQGKKTGRMPLVTLWSLLTFLGVAIIGWWLMPQSPLDVSYPVLKGLNTKGGIRLSPEFMALLSGLVLYTAAFIGEVVRAGIQSVSKGQVEAARALGLNGFQSLRLVVFPQAMRVIVPPLTSQYLNLTKNSSLAVAIGYPDIFSVGGTVFNTSGRAVEVITLIMGFYLTTSLLTSFFMNWYNQRIRLVER